MKHQPIPILLIDGDLTQLGRTQSLLGQAGSGEFLVETAALLAAAITRLGAGGIHLVLLELRLPDASGCEAVTKIREYAPSIPIVVLTAHDDEALALEALKLGAQDFLVKDRVDWPSLRRALRFAAERTRLERKLIEEHRRLTLLLENIPDRVYFKDEKSRFLEINRSLANRFELTNPEEVAGKTDADFFSEEHASEALADEREVMRTGRPIIAKVEHESMPDGTFSWALTTKMALRDDSGRIIGTFGISHDITELKRAEQAVRESEERYGRLLDSVTDYVYTVEIRDGRVTSTRHGTGCLAVTGYASDDFKTESLLWYRIIHPEDREAVIAKVQEMAPQGFPSDIEHRIIRKGGTVRWVRNKQVPRHDSTGKLIAYDGLISDITERKHAEEQLVEANSKLREVLADLLKSHEELKSTQLQLIQAEKLQSVEQLAAGVAHEVKNPLAILQMGIQFFAEYGPGSEEAAESVLHEMREAVKRADSVIGDLVTFSSSQELSMRRVAINSLLEQTLRLVRPDLAKADVKTVTQFAQNLPLCRVDPTKIEQVLVNVISNACHAMPSGGTLTITTFEKTIASADVNFVQGDRSGRRLRQGNKAVVIEIRDTGTGISADKLASVFDPFFTTKKTGKGTGLGLSVANKIIDLHDGEIRIENAENGGAKVTIVLPNEA